ncbi:MAG: molybdopterin cofactor-binding domain-containing protein [Burkholderiaceae bacterium]
MKRRTFLLAGAGVVGAAGALVIGWGVLPARSRLGTGQTLALQDGAVALNGWVAIAPDGTVRVAMPRSEMGQGVTTALPMLVAEELDCELSQIKLVQAPHDAIHGNVAMLIDALPFHPDEHGSSTVKATEWIVGKVARELGLHITGGSSSVKDAWQPMRMAGATARAMLLSAAAGKLGVPATECSVKAGVVTHKSGKSVRYGELAKDAASRPIPDVELKNPRQFTLLGQPTLRLDAQAKSDGTAQFGIDVRPEGLLFAAVAMCPTFGGRLQRFDANAVLQMPGVVRVTPVPGAFGAADAVAVIARSTWQAKQAIAKLPVVWDAGRNADMTHETILADMRKQLEAEKGWSYHDRGDGEAAFNAAAKKVQAEYTAPYLAHATMEPMNCTAQFKDGKLTIWAPTQVPGPVKLFIGRLLDIESDAVTVNVTMLGGGFGRRLDMDFIAQAVQISAVTQGAPVQLLWSREDDTRHDHYRPAAIAQLRGGLDAQNNLQTLATRQVSGSITYDWMRRAIPAFAAPSPDKTTNEGIFDRPYAVPHQSHRQVAYDSPVPLGFWRSVGHSMNAFFSESFMDECAHAAGKDPFEFRRALLQRHPRHLKVLETVAQRSNWSEKPQAGRARGIALHHSFGSIVGQVAEVSVEANKITVHKVWCAIDCGFAVNPNIIAQQMESSVVYGLTAALYGEITLKNGAVVQGNFGDYPVLRMPETPWVETTIIASSEPPGGVGEPGTPPIAPAVANAVFALTGKRLRALPLKIA